MSKAVAVGRGERFGAARALVESARRVVITTHVQPDGDGIGSEVALARWLRREGKHVVILNPNPTPKRYDFFEAVAPVEGYTPARADDVLAAADLLIVLDISVPARLGALEPHVREHGRRTLIIDHHADPATIPGVDVRDTQAAATGEIIYRMLRAWNAEIDPPMATALYAAIAYDTGGFRYGNTRAESHEIAADLIRHGADLALVRHRLFESISEGRARLMAHALSRFERSPGGRVAWVAISNAELEAVRADPEDIDGVVEALRAIDGVEVALVGREAHEGATKLSFRSLGPHDVNAFARQFGGGGHKNAAGAYLKQPLAEVMARIVPAARAAFEPADREPSGEREESVERGAGARNA